MIGSYINATTGTNVEAGMEEQDSQSIDWERILVINEFKLDFCEKFNLAMAELGKDPACSEIVEIMLEAVEMPLH